MHLDVGAGAVDGKRGKATGKAASRDQQASGRDGHPARAIAVMEAQDLLR